MKLLVSQIPGVSDYKMLLEKVVSEWHFLATSHGKSQCDGVGGTVKRLVSRASLQLITDAIDTAEKIFYWRKENINGIKFFYA